MVYVNINRCYMMSCFDGMFDGSKCGFRVDDENDWDQMNEYGLASFPG